MNYYKRHIGDYIRDTSHLTLLEHGAYTRLLDLYYVREAPLPDDQVCRLVGARTPDEISTVKAILAEFFELVEEVTGQVTEQASENNRMVSSRFPMWFHKRCQSEIANANASAKTRRLNGQKGGRKKIVAKLCHTFPAEKNEQNQQVKPKKTEHLPKHKPDVDEKITENPYSTTPLLHDSISHNLEASTPLSGPPLRAAEQPADVPITLPAPVVSEPPASRGKRLPAAWQPSEADEKFCLGLGLLPGDIAPQFADYWHAQVGNRACKADWSATWRVWCRKTAEDRQGADRRPRATSRRQGAPESFYEQGKRVFAGLGPYAAKGGELSDDTIILEHEP